MSSFLCGKTLPGTVCALAVLIAAAPPTCPAQQVRGARLAWSAYIGDQNETQLARIAVDAAGNTYAAGSRLFRDYTYTEGGSRLTVTTDVLVVKLAPDGEVVYTTYLGGKGSDAASAIAVDRSGNVWVAGRTSSKNFPLRNPLQTEPAGAFIAKLSPEGYVLFSTYFGGWSWDRINAIAVDSSGAAYVTGQTFSSSFPVTQGALQTAARVSNSIPIMGAGFVSKISPSGQLVYSTYLAGSGYCQSGGSHCLSVTLADAGTAITVDAAGNAFVAGYSNRGNLPATPGAIQQNTAAVFVAKLNAAGSALIYLTGLGGSMYGPYRESQYDAPNAIAVDTAGNAYVAGRTASTSFPTQSALQATFGGPPPASIYEAPPYDVFVSKINPAGTALIYSTYYGGPGEDVPNAMAVDAQGNAYITGTSAALDIAADPTLPQGSAFLIQLNPAGSSLVYSTRLPKGAGEADVALDSTGKMHLGGSAGLVSVLDTAGAPARTIMGISNAAAAHVSTVVAANEVIAVWGQGLGPAAPATAALDSSGAFPKNLSDTQVFFDEIPAPLLYVSDRQINTIVPNGIAGRPLTRMRVVYRGQTTRELTLAVGRTATEIFRNADGSAAALNQDSAANSPANPAPPGSIVAVYVTPTGGQCVDGAINPLNLSGSSGLTLGGLEVTYLGPAPALVCGVSQINFRLPDSPLLQGNKYYIPLFDSDTVPAEPVYIYVKQ